MTCKTSRRGDGGRRWLGFAVVIIGALSTSHCTLRPSEPAAPVAEPTVVVSTAVPDEVVEAEIEAVPLEEAQLESIQLEAVGHVGGGVMAVALQGKTAYVGKGLRLAVFDVADGGNPRLLGQSAILPDVVAGVAISGNHAFIAAGRAGLRVLDISDPAAPREIGSAVVKGQARNVALADSVAYVAASRGGLRMFDVSNPTVPVEVGSIDTEERALDVAVVDDRAFVAELDGGLHIYFVGDPTSPIELGSLPHKAIGVAVQGQIAFVAGDSQGLLSIVTGVTEEPFLSSVVNTPFGADSVAVVGEHAYVGDVTSLRVIDVSDLSNLREVGHVDTPGFTRDVAVTTGRAFVASGHGGLRVIDVSRPASPVEIGVVESPYKAIGVAVSDGVAIIAGHGQSWIGNGGLQALDVSDPVLPRELGAIELGGNARRVVLSGGLAYVAAGFSGLRVVDLGNPAAMRVVGTFDSDDDDAQDVAVSGAFAYVANGNGGLRVFDISDPATVQQVGSVDVWARQVAVGQKYAYAVYVGDFHVIDITNPALPQVVDAGGALGNLGWVDGVAVAGEHLFVVSEGVLHVLAADDPNAAEAVGNVGIPEVEIDGEIAVVDSRVYVAGERDVWVFDLSDPAQPRFVGSSSTPGTTNGFAVSGSHLYLASGNGGVVTLRVENADGIAQPDGS